MNGQGSIDIKAAPVGEIKQAKKLEDRIKETDRNVAVFGVGDGGSNIGSEALKKHNIPAYIYNTSPRGLVHQKHTKAVILEHTDGSGQDMVYASKKYDDDGFAPVCEMIAQYCTQLDYLFPTATAGGGTGAGTIGSLARDIHENFSQVFTTIPVCVLPSHQEAEKNFYNALNVIKSLVDSKLPYFVFDNNHYLKMGITSDIMIHEYTNREIVKLFALFKGITFNHMKAKNILDSKDFKMITNHGGRMNYFHCDEMITARETLDEYLIKAIQKSPQPAPASFSCYGLFVKAPEDILSRLNTSIPEVRSIYGFSGQSFLHTEVSDTFEVGFLTSGSLMPENTIIDLKALYQDAKRRKERKENSSLLDDIDEDIVSSSDDTSGTIPTSFKKANRK